MTKHGKNKNPPAPRGGTGAALHGSNSKVLIFPTLPLCPRGEMMFPYLEACFNCRNLASVKMKSAANISMAMAEA